MTQPDFTKRQFVDNNPPSDAEAVSDVYAALLPILDLTERPYGKYQRVSIEMGKKCLQSVTVFEQSGESRELFLEIGDAEHADDGEIIINDKDSAFIVVSGDGMVTKEADDGSYDNPQNNRDAFNLLLSVKEDLPAFSAMALQKTAEIVKARDEVYKWMIQPEYRELTAAVDRDVKSLLAGSEYEGVVEMLDSHGLQPKYMQSVGDQAAVYYSDIFGEDGGRKYVVAYSVHPHEGVFPQVLYTSKSQQCWRWLPGKSEKGWYDKGTGEDTLDVAPMIQNSLATILQNDYLTVESDTMDAILNTTLITPVVDKTSADYTSRMQYFDRDIVHELPDDMLPDFAVKKESVGYMDELYGKMNVDTFASHDSRVTYRFAHNEEGVAWLVQSSYSQSPLRMRGLNNNRVLGMPSVSAKPGYEYKSQIQSHTRMMGAEKGRYSDNFGYLSTQPLIRKYYKTIPPDALPFAKYIPDGGMPSVEMVALWRQYQSDAGWNPVSEDVKKLTFEIASMINDDAYIDDTSSDLRREQTIPIVIINELQKAMNDQSLASERTFNPPMKRVFAGSLAAVAYARSLDLLRFTNTYESIEKHDETVRYIHFSSPDYPGCRIEMTKSGDDIVGFDASYVGR